MTAIRVPNGRVWFLGGRRYRWWMPQIVVWDLTTGWSVELTWPCHPVSSLWGRS